MGWRDTLSVLNAPKTFTPPAPVTPPRPSVAPRYSSIAGPSLAAPALRPPGSPGGSRGGTARPQRVAAAPEPRVPAAPPEVFRASLPFSTRAPDEPSVGVLQPASYRNPTRRNPGLLEIGQNVFDSMMSVGQQVLADVQRPETGGVNVGNFATIPYQAPGGLIHAFGKAFPSGPAQFAENEFNVAMDALKTVAAPIAYVANAPERIARDQTLKVRATGYAAFIAKSNPQLVALAANADPLQVAANPIDALSHYIGALFGSDGEQTAKITEAMFDLPDAVKAAIRADPSIVTDDAKLGKLLDEAGRQWTYRDGLQAAFENIAPGFAILAGEVALAGPAAGLLRSAGAASTVPGIARATEGLATASSWAIKVHKAALAAGIGSFAVTTAIDAGARAVGNQAALNFATDAFSYHPISENPDVMFVSSMTVNPFHAVGALRRGVVKLGYGADVTIGKALGARYIRTVTTTDQLETIMSRIYGIPKAAVPDAINRFFISRGEATDHVVNLATQDVVNRLPASVKNTLATTFTDPVKRTQYVLREHGAAIMDTLEHNVDRLADMARKDFHAYEGAVAPYEPYRALAIGADYRAAKNLTWRIRAEVNAVVTYPDVLIPDASSAIRAELEAAPARVPDTLVADLTAKYRGFIRYVRPLVSSAKNGTYAKDDLMRVLGDAESEFNRRSQQNPILFRNGIEPVLRPNATVREIADSVGAEPPLIDAVFGHPDPPAQVDTIKAFLASKKAALALTDDLIAQMTPEEAWNLASRHVDETTRPFFEMGKQVASAEAMAKVWRERAAEARAAGDSAEADRLLKQVMVQEELIRGATGPLVPFTSTLRNALDASGISDPVMRDLARKKVFAKERIAKADAILDEVRALVGDRIDPAQALAGVRRTEDGWVWDGNVPAPSSALLRKLETNLRYTPDSRVNVRTASNFERWALIRKYAGSTNPLGHKFELTVNQSKELREAITFLRTHAVDDLAGAGVRGGVEETVPAQLGKLREQYDTALEGVPRRVLERDASRAVPTPYLEHAQGGTTDEVGQMAGSVFVHDYVAETQGIREITGQIATALSHPDDPAVYGTVADLVRGNDLLYSDLVDAAYARNVDVDSFLSDPRYAGDIRAALPNVQRSPTPLDEALIAAVATGDRAALEAALNEVDLNASLGRPKPPIQGVTLADAEAIAADQVPPVGSAEREAARKAWDDAKAALQAGIAERDAVYARAIADARAGKPVVHPETGDPLTGKQTEILRTLRNGRKAHPPETSAVGRLSKAAFDARTAYEKTGGAVKPRVRRAPQRMSVEYDKKLRAAQADFSALPSPVILAKPENAVGRQVLSLIGWAVPDRDPSTLNDLLIILKEIENGNAEHAGFGAEVLAKGQRLAEQLLDHAISRTNQRAFIPGVLGKGIHAGQFNPDGLELAKRLINEGLVAHDPSSPIGLQYALGKAPKDAVVLGFEDMRRLADESGVPSLAEELFTGHFHSYEQRVHGAKIKQAVNWFFGGLGNRDIAARARSEFIDRAAQQGVAPYDAERVWQAWNDYAHQSNIPRVVRNPDGTLGAVPGNLSLLASPTNTPNGTLFRVAREAIMAEHGGTLNGYDNVAWDFLFREASSPVMRALADAPVPFGRKLEQLYSIVTNNDWVRFRYYQFRFAVDIRFHAMNFFEQAFLYSGRTALRPGDNNAGLLGATHDWLVRMGENHIGNTGYAFTRSRMLTAERAFLKEQPDALRNALRDLSEKDPELIRQAFVEEARLDPELAKTIDAMGDTPEGYIAAMDRWYNRILNATDPSEPFASSIAHSMENEPAMAEVYSTLANVNRELWDDVRATFLGNANRSRVERALNHYLLYWPISYQIRTTKWLLRVMYDRAGGLPTNSLGAYEMDKLIGLHNHMLATNPDYQRTMKDNPALLFAAQMLFPITPNSIGVSLNPIMRDLFFGRTKNALDVGPVYTITKFIPNVVGELYNNLYDVPVFRDIMPVAVRLTGRTPRAPGEDDPVVPPRGN